MRKMHQGWNEGPWTVFLKTTLTWKYKTNEEKMSFQHVRAFAGASGKCKSFVKWRTEKPSSPWYSQHPAAGEEVRLAPWYWASLMLQAQASFPHPICYSLSSSFLYLFLLLFLPPTSPFSFLVLEIESIFYHWATSPVSFKFKFLFFILEQALIKLPRLDLKLWFSCLSPTSS